jgi:hypothetical protein
MNLETKREGYLLVDVNTGDKVLHNTKARAEHHLKNRKRLIPGNAIEIYKINYSLIEKLS